MFTPTENRRIAKAGGFSLVEGAYQGTTDDRLGRWYIRHESQDYTDKSGPGFATQKDAWAEAAHLTRLRTHASRA